MWQPIICTSCCRAHHRLSTKYCNITKTQGEVPSIPPPLYLGGGVTLLVHPRVKDNFVRFQTVFGDASKLRFMALMINSSGLNQIVVVF